MVCKDRLSCRTAECEAEFEVANFTAVCAVTKTRSKGKDSFHEVLSNPILCYGDYQFGIAVVWGADKNGNPDRDKNIGIYVQRMDRTKGSPSVHITMSLLNRDPSKNKKFGATELYEAIGIGSASGWSPSFGAGIPGLTLGLVLDPAKGWLHENVLRVSAKLTLVLGLEKGWQAQPMPNMQQEVCESFQTLLDSARLADVTLVVGGERIEAHSLVLMARSSVFDAMFSTSMRESREKEVVIEDLKPSAVRELLSFFYAGSVKKETLDQDDTTLHLLQAAHRYEAAPLIEVCTQALRSRLTADNVSERLEIADLMGCPVLREQCLEFMQRHMADVKATDAYSRLVERHPSLLKDIVDAISGPPRKKRRQ
uniref:BTB domain-containing protein n=1 Tax=Alexandrium andersonii TaxID=327968 RepID=A0A7S2EZD4_9DINO|mmetsp:Transcript_10141/g.23086  ORF Transcript_10141/g.23086 Transcript_10141/m.23086 type:complete len:368 (+) Transcript_10141:64-1167(+)